MSGNCDIALIGLAVMGQNLVLNMNDNNIKVAVYKPHTGAYRKNFSMALQKTPI